MFGKTRKSCKNTCLSAHVPTPSLGRGFLFLKKALKSCQVKVKLPHNAENSIRRKLYTRQLCKSETQVFLNCCYRSIGYEYELILRERLQNRGIPFLGENGFVLKLVRIPCCNMCFCVFI